MLVAKLHTEPPGHFCTQTAWNKEEAAIPMRLYDAKEQAELTLYIPVSLLGTRCMRPVLRPLVDRRHLLTLGAKLSIATFASVAIWPHSGASQSGLVEGYAEGDGVRLCFVQGGEGQLMLFLHGVPDSWTLYTSQLAEFSRDHMVVAPNLRGFSPSDQPKAVDAYAMPRLLGDVHACFGISAVSSASWWAMTGLATLLGYLLRPIQAALNAWSSSMRRTQPYCSERSAIARRKFRHRNTSAIITVLLPLIRPGTITTARIPLRCLLLSLMQRIQKCQTSLPGSLPM